MVIRSHYCEFNLFILDSFKIVDPYLYVKYTITQLDEPTPPRTEILKIARQ